MEANMNRPTFKILLTLLAILVFAFPIPAAAAGPKVIPTFSIVKVTPNVSVTITTYNFPAHDSFDVLMNVIGTRGIGGYWVASVYSGSGGSQTFTFNIPAALHGQAQIAIRLQSNTGSGYYSFNWFYNTGYKGGTGGRGVRPYPTFWISGVVRDNTVTVVTQNLPPNEAFRVRMGPMGTRGINGYVVTTFNTGSGGSQVLTFSIPAPLYGSHKISIRMDSISGSGFYAYNWFFNNTTY